MAENTAPPVRDLCYGCKAFVDIAYWEQDTNRAFCQKCALELPPTSEELALLFIALTTPFKVGDRVEARTAGEIFDGVGTVTDMFTDLEHGGTLVYPTWRVVIDEPAYEGAPEEALYTEICLKKVKVDS